MLHDHTEKAIRAFLGLLKAGLWQTEVCQIPDNTNYTEVFDIAQDQVVEGLIAAGLETMSKHNVPKDVVLTFVGSALQIEQRNQSMNNFISRLITKLREDDVYVILIKGQGLAQCYEKPLWRSCGDVDLLVSDSNYERVKNILAAYSKDNGDEISSRLHISYLFEDTWVVELHGSLRSRLIKSMDKAVDKAVKDMFYGGEVRSWYNGSTCVFLPEANVDVLIVFSHIIEHYYGDGIGLRQICDWCRLLWTYRESIDIPQLKERIMEAALTAEWKTFGYLAVEYLGMPVEAMPFYSSTKINRYRAKRVLRNILKVGNFGQNRDFSYAHKNSFIVRKIISLFRHTWDNAQRFFIFPQNSARVWCRQMVNGTMSVFGKR